MPSNSCVIIYGLFNCDLSSSDSFISRKSKIWPDNKLERNAEISLFHINHIASSWMRVLSVVAADLCVLGCDAASLG